MVTTMNLLIHFRFTAQLLGACMAWGSVLSAWALEGDASNVTDDRPNILWITAEDMSATLGCYGDSFATTPNIDRLASESCRYTNAFATSPVCSPSRACLINACIAPHTGTHPMRSLFPLPEPMNGFPALLRHVGYFTSNNVKTDYNTSSEQRIIAASWDRNGSQASWHLRDEGQRFFSIHNLMTSHQSRTMVWPYEQFEQEVQSRLDPSEIHDPMRVPLPPYYPDTPLVRRTLARYYDCVTVMDKEVGEILDRLEADGLSDDTIVFFYSDHGSGMPRHKRALFDSGMHVPLLIRFPDKYQHLAPCKPGETTDRLVSFEDFGPTVLSLAGISELPGFMRGKPFLGSLAGEPRSYVYGHRDRVDEIIDCARSVRSKKYLYIRNYMPHLGYHQPSAWVDQGEVKEDFYALADSGKATEAQWQFLGPTRPREELYDCKSDPMNLNNLAESADHQDLLNRFRGVLRRELIASSDLGFVPEIELWRQTAGTTPRQAAAAGRFDVSGLIDAAEMVGRDDFEAIATALADQDPCIRYWAAVACSATESLPIDFANRLREHFSDPSDAVRIEAAGAIAKHLEDPSAFDLLLELTRSSNETTILHAARKLELLANPLQREQIQALADRFADAPGDVAWCIRFTTSAYLRRVK
jgi:arylsulfatase A-like enzyme